MLADALRSETYRLLRNRTAVFWSLVFVPVIYLILTATGHVFLKSRMQDMAAGLPPELLAGGPLDLGRALAEGAGNLANPALLAFLLIGAATVFAGDYRWETWRLVIARNSRLNLLLGKVGVVKLLSLAAMAALVLSGLAADIVRAQVFERPLAFTFGLEQARTFGLLFLLSYVRVVQFLLLALLAATVTRSLLATLFIPVVVGVAQSLLGQVAPLLGLEPGSWTALMLMPGQAFDMLKSAVLGGMEAAALPAGVVPRALVSLAVWIAVPLGAALWWFQRQDLSKE